MGALSPVDIVALGKIFDTKCKTAQGRYTTEGGGGISSGWKCE
jgi:thiamine monophosphate synthase